MKLFKLKEKVVINTNTGEMLGYIHDLEIDMKTYTILSFVIEDRGGFMSRILPWIFKGKSYIVTTNQINSIGNDVILVENEKKGK